MTESLDIIVPCFNPSKGWERDLLVQYKALKQLLDEVDIQCILVNDGSTVNVDETAINYLKHAIPSLQYLSLSENRGKGYAIRHGAKHASGTYLAFTDIDFPYQSSYMEKMYRMISKNEADIVIGHRKEAYYQQIPLHRRILSKSLRRVVKFLLSIPVTDTQSGLKFFNENGKDILLATHVDRYLFDLELIKMAAKKDIRISSIELALRDGIELPSFALATLMSELKNFIRILFN